LAYTTNENRTFLLLFYTYDDDGDGVDDDDGEVNDVHNNLNKDKINFQNDNNQVMDNNIHMDSDVEKWVVNKHVLYDDFH
jgi:hypothetical protein